VNRLLVELDARPVLTRQDFPYETDIYPFPFELAPLGAVNLAKFVYCEADPVRLGHVRSISNDSVFLVDKLKTTLGGSINANHVGKLYDAMVETLAEVKEAGGVRLDFDFWFEELGRVKAEGEFGHFQFFHSLYEESHPLIKAIPGIWTLPANDERYPSYPVPVNPTAYDGRENTIKDPDLRALAWLGNLNYWCQLSLLDSSYRRKSKPDYAVEAAVLSKKIGKPIKVIWSREDDIKFDYYHSVAAMYMKAALDDSGKPKAWLQRSVFPPIGSTFDASANYGGAGEMSMGWDVVPFDIANFRSENGQATAHVRIGWLRSVANIYHAFAVQSFANELAYAANRDPCEYLMTLIGAARTLDAGPQGSAAINEKYPYDLGRLRQVAEIAAEKANWGKKKPGKGSGMGIAVHRSFFTYVATVVEVEVDDQGAIRIPHVYTALDAGIVANPEMVRQQFEGAAVFGTSIARTGEITATAGAVDQSNFFDYQVARMNDAPRQVDIHIVESTAPPAGVGEPGVPPFVPALCNAVFAATGKRVRELPLTRNGFS